MYELCDLLAAFCFSFFLPVKAELLRARHSLMYGSSTSSLNTPKNEIHRKVYLKIIIQLFLLSAYCIIPLAESLHMLCASENIEVNYHLVYSQLVYHPFCLIAVPRFSGLGLGLWSRVKVRVLV